MNFDPISYAIHRMDYLQARVKDLEQQDQKIAGALGSHDKRIGSLESWRQSLTRTLRKWPYLVVPLGLTALNLAPGETVGTVAAIIKALL